MLQVLSVNFLYLHLSRSLQIYFDWLFQLAVTLVCLGAGLLAHGATSYISILGASSLLPAFQISGIFHLQMLVCIIVLVPGVAGLCREEVETIRSALLRKIRRYIGF